MIEVSLIESIESKATEIPVVVFVDYVFGSFFNGDCVSNGEIFFFNKEYLPDGLSDF